MSGRKVKKQPLPLFSVSEYRLTAIAEKRIPNNWELEWMRQTDRLIARLGTAAE
ncbi:MAG: hypothetical protein FWH41_08115 [Treponema sp.]|nr:hypothetical protein [Treponema sp.]